MKRALISVYDKDGIVEFANSLKKLGWDIISTGGTYRLLKENNIDVIEVDEITDFKEILDGRVKTLNPRIHGGILFKRDNKEHRKTIEDLGILPIHMVVNNLYPFEETVNKEGVSLDEIIENIDIGGPSMIRAAAKNYQDVTVIVDPKDYNSVLAELIKDGETTNKTREYLAAKVFSYTSYYDTLIAKFFNDLVGIKFPDYLSLGYKKKEQLRYGENPHQEACLYTESSIDGGSILSGVKLHGKELSYNNINDGNAAISIIKEFERPTAVAIKHANPCGVASGENILKAYKKAYECDSESIFGGIVALNRQVDEDLAKELNKIFLEIVIAPSFSDAALEVLKGKKNIRLIKLEDISIPYKKSMDIKKIEGGLLIQDKNQDLLNDDMEISSELSPSEEDIDELVFAWKVAKHINSNGVVITKDEATIGIGLGEVNRFFAVEGAIKRAGEKAKGAYLASDGFFPFKDSIEALSIAGIRAIIQPGGSLKDDEVIEKVNEEKMIMVLTGIRHFKH